MKKVTGDTTRILLSLIVLACLFFTVIPVSASDGTGAEEGDLDTPSVIDTIRIGEEGHSPDAGTLNSLMNIVFADNVSGNATPLTDGYSANVSGVNETSLLTGIAVNPDSNRIYVADFSNNNILVLDGATNNQITTVGVGSRPWGVAVSSITNRIYVTHPDTDNISVIDGLTNSVITTVNASDSPLGISVNPATNRIYVANSGSNNVSVINSSTNNVVATVNAGQNPRDIAVNPSTNRIYVANSQSNNVSVINGSTNSVVATVGVGAFPRCVAVNPSTNRIYVTNLDSDNVSVIDGSANSVVTTVSVGDSPCGIAVNPTTNHIFVANNYSNSLSVIDGATNSVAAVDTGAGQIFVAVNPVTNRIYVVVFLSNTVIVLQEKLPTTTTLTADFSSPVFGQEVNLTATVVPNSGTRRPAGTVLFKEGSKTLGSIGLNGEGKAVLHLFTLAMGTHYIVAEYGGNDFFVPSSSTQLTITIRKANTSVTTASSVNPSTSGKEVQFTAAVNVVAPGAGTPAGTVTFKEGITTLGSDTLDVSGQAEYSTSDLAVGSHVITAVYNGNGNFQASTSPELTQVVNIPSLEIITTSLNQSEGEVKITYPAQTLEAANGTLPYKWTIAEGKLPAGISLKGITGTSAATLTGKPTKAGTYTFTVRVTDKNKQTDDQDYSITVYPVPGVTTTSLPGAVVGVEYNQALSAKDGCGPYTWDVKNGPLPPGLVLEKDTGVLSGIPDDSITKSKTYKITFKVTDAIGGTAVSKSLSLKVTLPLAVTTASPLPCGDIGIKYSQTLKATGGSGKYSWKLADGSSLPVGMALSAKGIISGKVAAAGTYSFTVLVGDGTYSLEKKFSLVINKVLTITTLSLPDGLKGHAYLDGANQVTLTASGGDGNNSWTKTGKWPPGLTLDKVTGVISGIPTKAGTYAFTLKVTDGLKVAYSLGMTITIK
jgi:YVTN family beta-propeller protein